MRTLRGTLLALLAVAPALLVWAATAGQEDVERVSPFVPFLVQALLTMLGALLPTAVMVAYRRSRLPREASRVVRAVVAVTQALWASGVLFVFLALTDAGAGDQAGPLLALGLGAGAAAALAAVWWYEDRLVEYGRAPA